jgi:hypothetical protein
VQRDGLEIQTAVKIDGSHDVSFKTVGSAILTLGMWF